MVVPSQKKLKMVEEAITKDTDLPEGWEYPLLGDLVRITQGNSKLTKKMYSANGKYTAFSGSGPDGFLEFWEHEGEAIILSSVGARCGKCFKASGKWSAIANTAIIKPYSNDPTLFSYIFYLINNEDFWPKSGSAQPFVQTGVAQRASRVPMPPLGEQQRIISKLEELFQRVNTTHQYLVKVQAILKRFRQSVLAAACSGRLTADWRNKNQIDSQPEDSELPPGWCWTPLKELLPPGGIFDGPFGSNLKTADYTDKGVRVVRLENVGHLGFIHEKKAYISQEKYKSLSKHRVGPGDIIFASFIDEEIRACVLPELLTKAIAKADCFCLRPRHEVVDRHYLVLQLVSRESYEGLSGNVHGATRPRINTTQLRNLEVRICPLAEQKEIVLRAEALFKLADTIERRVGSASLRAEKLTQAILAKAFRGELVPTEAELARRERRSFETASELLARIKSERETKGVSQKVRRNRN